MSRSFGIVCGVLLALSLSAAPPASAKFLHSYAVKFVCGFNNTNLGVSSDGKESGEPPVKFGNYATEINIVNNNPNESPDSTDPLVRAIVEKSVLVLVDKGLPVGREPKVVKVTGRDQITIPPMQATMDDCNRIAEILWGAVPTPFPLTIGYLVVASTAELDVNAVYTAQTCSFWLRSPEKLECLDPEGKQQGMSLSVDVQKVEGRHFGN